MVPKCFSDPNFFFDPQFSWTQNILSTKNFFRPRIISDQKLFHAYECSSMLMILWHNGHIIMNVHECSCVLMNAYECLWATMSSHDTSLQLQPWALMSVTPWLHEHLWALMSAYGHPWALMSPRESLWTLINKKYNFKLNWKTW